MQTLQGVLGSEVVPDGLREIAEFSGYGVTPDGRVWSRRVKGANSSARGKLGPWKPYQAIRRTKGGKYVVVCFRDDTGKSHTRYVHRLVLEAFVGPCPPGMVACHNDGDSANNAVGNLRWDTVKNNIGDKYRHGTAYKSHCHRGHEMTPENTVVYGNRRGGCRTCRSARSRAYWQNVRKPKESIAALRAVGLLRKQG